MTTMQAEVFEAREVPTASDGRSRYRLSSTRTGVKSAPGDTIAATWNHLVNEARETAVEITPQAKTIAMFRLVPAKNSKIDLVPVQPVVLVPTHEIASGRGRITSFKEDQAGAFLDELFLDPTQEANDRHIWRAAQIVAEAEKPSDLTSFSRTIALLILLRAGAARVSLAGLPY